MKIINLVENTEGAACCGAEHGLSFYIETAKRRILMDTGASDLFVKNAARMGVDLTTVDTVVLSHGHYDHGGGLAAFSKINPEAEIYLQPSAFGAYYSRHEGEAPSYIGLSEKVRELPHLVMAEEFCDLGDGIHIFAGIGTEETVPGGNRDLKIRIGDSLEQDDFRHEQCLRIFEEGRSVLLSGCAHHGILNVLKRYRQLYGDDPDAVISGFHMMQHDRYSEEDLEEIRRTAIKLTGMKTAFYTGHCTGPEPFAVMKGIMGGQLTYVHSGDVVDIRFACG